MKKIIIATILAISSVSAFAQNASSTTAIAKSHQYELMRLGSVSASVGTLDELTQKIAMKAEAAGADYFRIIHLNTKNQGYATAVLYNNVRMNS